jgi:uncharacterized protein
MLERTLLRIAYVLAGVLSLAWLSLNPAEAATPDFPELTGRVVDQAGILSADTTRELDGILAGDEKQSGRQIVVVTLKSLQGFSIEDYGYQLGRHWGIGQKDKNTGALVIVAPNEHETRIEVGYGLEGDLTDAKSGVIINRLMLPAFRKGDYDAGVMNGTKAVLATLGNTNYAKPDYSRPVEDEEPSGWMTALIIFAVIFFFAGRSFFWPLLFMGGFGGGWGGRDRWGGGGGFGGGSWGGGGGFSGGGGSFGGGGASGRW